MPFLGIHLTKTISGRIYVGPSAMPALGREHYHSFEGIEPETVIKTVTRLCRLFLSDKQGFRKHVQQELKYLHKQWFAEEAKRLVPAIKEKHLLPSSKAGIRAQLYDRLRNELVMDFLLEQGRRSTHILNSISPAFTCAFSFARLVVNEIIKRENTNINKQMANAV
jgi:L-2-hydroxyglutarate oxidase LhgO